MLPMNWWTMKYKFKIIHVEIVELFILDIGILYMKQGWQHPQKITYIKPRCNYTRHFHSSHHHKWLSYQIICGKPVQNVEIDPQTKEIWPTELFDTLSVCE